jgi:hypothetical protein
MESCSALQKKMAKKDPISWIIIQVASLNLNYKKEFFSVY